MISFNDICKNFDFKRLSELWFHVLRLKVADILLSNSSKLTPENVATILADHIGSPLNILQDIVKDFSARKFIDISADKVVILPRLERQAEEWLEFVINHERIIKPVTDQQFARQLHSVLIDGRKEVILWGFWELTQSLINFLESRGKIIKIIVDNRGLSTIENIGPIQIVSADSFFSRPHDPQSILIYTHRKKNHQDIEILKKHYTLHYLFNTASFVSSFNDVNTAPKTAPILIIGASNAGLSQLERILDLTPGLSRSKTNFYANNKIPDFQELENCIATLRFGEYASFHLTWSENCLALLKKYRIKTICIIRDPRDMLVSNMLSSSYFFALSSKVGTNYHLQYKCKTDEERLETIMGNPEDPENYGKYLADYVGWIKCDYPLIIRYEDIMCVNFEDHKQRFFNQINRITHFTGLEINQDNIIDIYNNFLFSNRTSFRLDGVGAWQSYLTEKNKMRFKTVAGKFLNDLGYTQNDNW